MTLSQSIEGADVMVAPPWLHLLTVVISIKVQANMTSAALNARGAG